MIRPTTVREARRTLPTIMKGSEAVAVGDHYRIRAVIVPIPAWDSWNPKAKARALRLARAAFRHTLDGLS
jgi:hypothetical protein